MKYKENFGNHGKVIFGKLCAWGDGNGQKTINQNMRARYPVAFTELGRCANFAFHRFLWYTNNRGGFYQPESPILRINRRQMGEWRGNLFGNWK